MEKRFALGITAVAALLQVLQGCSTTPAPTPPASAAIPVPAAPTPRSSGLAVERQWLQTWFEGTPVRITQRSESAFSIEVPREYCFEVGKQGVKPPLAAVLDKLAQSLQRKPAARVELLAAPGDASAPSPLAQQRAEAVRQHLLARGVSSQQLSPPTAAALPAVQLRIGWSAP